MGPAIFYENRVFMGRCPTPPFTRVICFYSNCAQIHEISNVDKSQNLGMMVDKERS